MPAKTSKRLPTVVPASRRGQAGTSPPPNRRAASAALSTKLAKRAKKIGRPLAKIDEARVAELAFCGLSNRMIAVLVGVDDKTIANRFSALLDKKRAERQLAILKRQWEILYGAAGPGPAATLAIWLGKNELGQTDKRDVAVSGGLTVKVSITADKPEDTPKSEDNTIIDVTEVRRANLPTSLQADHLLEGPHDACHGVSRAAEGP